MIHPTKQSNPWIEIEQAQCQAISISDLPFINCTIKHHSCFKANTISTTLTAWWKAHKITNSTLAPCKYTSQWNNPNFLHNKKPLNFTTWKEKGITQLQHIIHNFRFISFEDLVQKYGIRTGLISPISAVKIPHYIKNQDNTK